MLLLRYRRYCCALYVRPSACELTHLASLASGATRSTQFIAITQLPLLLILRLAAPLLQARSCWMSLSVVKGHELRSIRLLLSIR